MHRSRYIPALSLTNTRSSRTATKCSAANQGRYCKAQSQRVAELNPPREEERTVHGSPVNRGKKWLAHSSNLTKTRTATKCSATNQRRYCKAHCQGVAELHPARQEEHTTTVLRRVRNMKSPRMPVQPRKKAAKNIQIIGTFFHGYARELVEDCLARTAAYSP